MMRPQRQWPLSFLLQNHDPKLCVIKNPHLVTLDEYWELVNRDKQLVAPMLQSGATERAAVKPQTVRKM